MNQAFADMIHAYQERNNLTGEQMWHLAKINSIRGKLLDMGAMPLTEDEARMLIKVFDFTKKEEEIVGDAVEKIKRGKGTQTPFGRFMQLYRMRNNLILGHMARKVMASSSYVSGVEHGRYPLESAYVEKLIEQLSFTEKEQSELRQFVKEAHQ